MKISNTKNSYNYVSGNRGMTLIEVVLYVVLLSFLLSGFIKYAFAIYDDNINLMNDVIEAQNE